jgi:hypothetical protein
MSGNGVNRRASSAWFSASAAPVSASREPGNVLRDRSESVNVPPVESGVPSEVCGTGLNLGFTIGGATLIVDVSGVARPGVVIRRSLELAPGVWKVPGELPGPG